jgi:creatinine amidohydrolase
MEEAGRVWIWERSSWPELQAASEAGAVVVVPLGATEQHGPHLPVCTDSFVARELAVRAARLASVPVVVGPVLSLGYSAHHRHHAGTISLRAETLAALLTDVCRSVRSHGFERIFILNGHGGNGPFIEAIVAVLAEEGLYVTAGSWWAFAGTSLERVLESDLGGASHACELETSVMLALGSELVGEERTIELSRPETEWGWYDFRPAGQGVVAFPLTPRTTSRSGVYGDPTRATAAKGEEIVEEAVVQIARFLEDLRAWRPESEEPS